jgi:hypothetical protein
MHMNKGLRVPSCSTWAQKRIAFTQQRGDLLGAMDVPTEQNKSLHFFRVQP